MTAQDSPHVVVLGGGLAGVACAHRLGDEGVRVTLVDRNDYHQFQPLLYQVATSQLPAEDIARPHRVIFREHPSIEVVTASVTGIDPDTHSVTLADGRVISGSHLVLAAGGRAEFFGVPGAEEHAFPLYSVVDAERLRRHVRGLLESAGADESAPEDSLDIVVVGGGPTGVEVAGAFAELSRALSTLGDIPRAGRIILVDRGEVVLGPFSDKSHRYAHDRITKEGVELRLGAGVAAVHDDRVELDDGTALPTRTVIWGGGESGAPIVAASGLPLGRGGRIDVQADLTVADHPQVYAVGDVANIPAPDGGGVLPQLGSVAQQAGRWAADNILHELRGEDRKPFQYKDKGIMAMIGRNAAVAEVGKHRHEVEGPLAFAAWLGVHAMLLSGAHSKTDAFLSWAWDYFDRDHAAVVESSRTPKRIAWGDAAQDLPHIAVEPDAPATAQQQPPSWDAEPQAAPSAPAMEQPGASQPATAQTPKEDPVSEHYDVIIVGSGAGGGTLAHRLAPSGKRVLVLERGDWLPREAENWDAEAVFVNNRYISPDTWYDARGHAFQPQVHYFVGGATKFYGAALYRLRERDFGELKHHGGISPAWPIGYDVMEPYYTAAERLYQVHGLRGEDPTEPPSSAPYPFPPVSHEPRIQRLFDDLTAVGLHPFHAPSGIMLDEASPESSLCIRCATCDGFPCMVHAKSDAEVVAMRPALQHDNVTLVRNARVRRLETDASGRTVTAVVTEVEGEEQRFSGDIVVLSAGAVNSAAILLASANDRHPHGLANGSDQVGRNYVFHNSRAFLAVSTEPNDTRFQKTLGMNDFYFGDMEFDYPMGNLQMVGKSSAPMYRGEKPLETELAPTFTLKDVAAHAIDFWLSVEDLPDPDNRVTLTSDGSVGLSYTPNNQEPMNQLYHRVKKHLSHLGMHPHHLVPRTVYMKNDIPVAGCAHQAGTVRFGHDPATSVLDVNCKAHELDNLYVVDTSFFPSIGAVNPALTAIANALRVGDHLVDRLG